MRGQITKKQFSALLRELGACYNAKKWAENKTSHVVWTTCERADWLLWLVSITIGKPGWPTHQQVVLAACACAEISLEYIEYEKERSRKAIEITRKWTKGEATLEEVKAACYSTSNAAHAAAYTTCYPTYAPKSAPYTLGAFFYGSEAATLAAHVKMCKFIRSIIPEPKGR